MATALATTAVYILCALCFIQRRGVNFYVASVFAFVYLSHIIIFSDLDGWLYYGTDAALNLVIIFIICRSAPATELGLSLQSVCATSIALNFAGYLMWLFYLEPTMYNWSFVVLNYYAVYCLTREGIDNGDSANNSGLPFLHSDSNNSA